MEDKKIVVSKNGLFLASLILLISLMVGYKVYKKHIVTSEEEQKIESEQESKIKEEKSIELVINENIIIPSIDSSIIENKNEDKIKPIISSHTNKVKEKVTTENSEQISEKVEQEIKEELEEKKIEEVVIKKVERKFGPALVNSNNQEVSGKEEKDEDVFIPIIVHRDQEIKNGDLVTFAVGKTIKVGGITFKEGQIIKSQATFKESENRINFSVANTESGKGFFIYGVDKVKGIAYQTIHPLKKSIYFKVGSKAFLKKEG